MPLSQEFRDELLLRCDIVDVVSKTVNLKKRGSNYWGLCPFHNEKTPSFSVSADKQIFKCFGCGEGGNVISFVMKSENLTYIEAVRSLAEQYGMSMPDDQTEDAKKAALERDELLSINRQAAKFYFESLAGENGKQALEYLLNRGLTKQTIQSFGLGWGGSGWDGLALEMRKRGVDPEKLVRLGLVRRGRNGGYYDTFRQRIIFPIIDTRGRVVAFGGRIIDGDGAKYINSQDTPLFNKSQNLFAANFAKKSKRDYWILAEGYMDVIALHQAGFDCAVASLGTSLTQEQAKLISQHVEKVIISYDSDNAGMIAAKRAIDILKRSELQVRVLHVPDGKDPDEFLKKNGAEAFQKVLKDTMSDTDYILSEIMAQNDVKTDDGKIAFLSRAVPVVAAISNAVEKEIYTKKIAGIAGISVSAVESEIKIAEKKTDRKNNRAIQNKARSPVSVLQSSGRKERYKNPTSAFCEEKLICLFLTDNDLLKKYKDRISSEDFSSQTLARIFDSVLRHSENSDVVNAAMIMEDLSEQDARHFVDIMSDSERSMDAEKEVLTCMEKILFEHSKSAGVDDRLLAEAIQKKRNRTQGG